MKTSIKTTMAIAAMFLSTLATAQTIHTFSYDGGKRAEVYIGYADGIYVRTPVTNYDTKFVKGSRSDCEYKKHGSCKSKSQMLSEIESKVRSGEYWR